MPDNAQVQPFSFPLKGGLVLNKSTYEMDPGAALELTNFEPDINGGYRRISGFTKWNTNVVPYTFGANEKVLMVAALGTSIVAARGEKIFTAATSTSSWVEIDTGRSGALRYTFDRYNLAGVDKLIVADGGNRASVYNGTTVVDIRHAAAPSNPKHAIIYKNHVFLSGHSANKQELRFSAPYSDSDFSPSSGGGSIQVDSEIVGLKTFREELYIFCKARIFKLTGSASADFTLQPVTRDIGCVNGSTIQEFAGDLIFLAVDGLRTIAGTAKIGDVELGTISKAIQPRFSRSTNTDQYVSVVIPNKTQYRLFFCDTALAESNTTGVICSLKDTGFEFADLKGIKPSCTDTDITGQTPIVYHGGYDGFIYRQEVGGTLNGATIKGVYRSPDISMGDPGIRKSFEHIILNYAPESTISANLFLRYDYEATDVARPDAYPFDSSQVIALYGVATYGGGSTYGAQSQPLVRQAVEGSGYAIALRVHDNGQSEPYSLRGFQLEYRIAGRR